MEKNIKYATIILFSIMPCYAMEQHEQQQKEVQSLLQQCLQKIPQLPMWQNPQQAIKTLLTKLPQDLIEDVQEVFKNYPYPIEVKKLPVHNIVSTDKFCQIGLKQSHEQLELLDMQTDVVLNKFSLEVRIKKAILSPDGNYIIALLNNHDIQIISTQNNTTSILLRLQQVTDISFIENTNFISFVDRYNTYYFGLLEPILEKAAELKKPLISSNLLKRVRSMPNYAFTTLMQPNSFFIAYTGTWPPEKPSNLHKSFNDIDNQLYAQNSRARSFVNPQGNFLVTTTDSQYLTIWNLEKKEPYKTMALNQTYTIEQLYWTPDERLLAKNNNKEYYEVALASSYIAQKLNERKAMMSAKNNS